VATTSGHLAGLRLLPGRSLYAYEFKELIAVGVHRAGTETRALLCARRSGDH